MPVEDRPSVVRPLTQGPSAHFFGSHAPSPWNASGRFLLALEAEADNRMPNPGERAGILLIDTESGAGKRIADTAAWNWQQGALLQWMPPGHEPEIVFNDIEANQFVAVILNVRTGARRVLPRPITSISRDGRFAVTLNFARLVHLRPFPDYVGVPDLFVRETRPASDGIWWMDLASGEQRLVYSIEAAVKLKPREDMEDLKHRFEAVTLNPSGTRCAFRHRWPRLIGGRPYNERLLTCDLDGKEPRILSDNSLAAHFDWRDDASLLAWTRREPVGERFFLLKENGDEPELVGGDVLTEEGHCAYSPDRRWLAADTGPDRRNYRQLILYEIASDRRLNLGAFATPPPFLRGELRCDLQPHWRRDGQEVCFTSAHEGVRQMYAVDVSPIVS